MNKYTFFRTRSFLLILTREVYGFDYFKHSSQEKVEKIFIDDSVKQPYTSFSQGKRCVYFHHITV